MNTSIYRSEYALVGLLIIVSVSPFFEGTGRLLGYLLIILFLSFRAQLKDYETIPIIITGLFFLFGVIPDLISSSGPSAHALGTHVLFLAGLVTGWVMATRINLEKMAEILANWAVFLAALSLVGVFLYTFVPEVISSLPTYSYHQTTHHTIGISNILVYSDGTIVHRNTGIASEPGLFQMILNLGAAAMLNVPKERMTYGWFFRFMLLGFAIVATRSTMGLIIFVLLLLLGALRSGKFGVSLVILGALGWETIRSEISYQQENKLAGSTSFEARATPTLEVLGGLLFRPFGVGNANYNANFEEMNWGAYDSLSQVLIRYGFPLGFLLCILLLRKVSSQPLIMLTVILTLASQPVWFTPLIAYFYYYKKPIVTPNFKRFRSLSYMRS